MKKLILALTLCFLMGAVSAPTQFSTAAPVGDSKAVVVITQEPVEDAATAKLVVEGPTKVKAGDLVVISVAGSNAESFKWIMPVTDNILVIEDGKRVIFSSGVGGEYRFIVACSLGGTCDVAEHTVTVLGAKPTPADILASRIAFYCEKVQSDTKRDDCLKLAQSFSSVAMVMEGGTLVTPADIVEATFKSNQDALGLKLSDWLPFREGMAKELKALADSGKLTDTASHITAWKAIAQALREYAATL